MSVRYPIVELLGGLAAWAVFDAVARSLPGEAPAWKLGALFAVDFALALGLVAAAFIDAEHMYLPDEITIGGAVLGLATASLREIGFVSSIEGALVGFLGVYVPFILLYKAIRGYPGMGLGDAKLLALAGAWFGWQGALVVLFAGAIQGTFGTIVIFLAKGKIEDPESVKRDNEELLELAKNGDAEAQKLVAEDPLLAEGAEGKARIPFGPFLILACLELLLAGDWIFAKIQSMMGLDS